MATRDQDSSLLSAAQIGKILGVSSRSIRRAASERRIPVIRVCSKTLRFRLADVQKALEKWTQKAL